MSNFSTFLSVYLGSNNLTAVEFGSSINYSADAVRLWYNGGCVPSIAARAVLAREFGCSLNEFEEKLFSDVKLPARRHTKISDMLLDYIGENKITCKAAAKIMNVNYIDVHCWIMGRRNPGPTSIESLARLLSISNVECAYAAVSSDDDYYATKMGCILRTLRYSIGAFTREMGEYLNMSRFTWCGWESRIQRPTLESVEALSAWLEVPGELIESLFSMCTWDSMDMELLNKFYATVYSKWSKRKEAI